MAVNYAIETIHLHKREGPEDDNDNPAATQGPWCRTTPVTLNGSVAVLPRIVERKSVTSTD